MSESDLAEQLPGGDLSAIVRRAPFSDNPQVGVRGQRAQQRILEAALQVFGELGYHQCGISRITEVAGCSRASFYQYFSSKEDVFRHLAGQVARQMSASAEALDPVTPDDAGWESLRAWVERHGAIYSRYEPVFQAFQAAAESDEAVAGGSAKIGERHIAMFRAKISGSPLPRRQLDAVIDLLQNCVTRTPRLTQVLRVAVPSVSLRKERVHAALADLIHRTLFGVDPSVNVQPPPRRRRSGDRLAAALRDGLADGGAPRDLTPAGARTLAALLDSAHEVLVTRGYHGTRVDDITSAAGVSHGAFYRYFPNKDQLVRVLAFRAVREVAAAFVDIPDVTDAGPKGSAALRKWLRRYQSSYAREAAMIRVWVDATADDPLWSLEAAAALEWGRNRMARYLEQHRRFGDIDTEALLLVVLLDALGAMPSSPDTIDAAGFVIERGLLGLDVVAA